MGAYLHSVLGDIHKSYVDVSSFDIIFFFNFTTGHICYSFKNNENLDHNGKLISINMMKSSYKGQWVFK